MSTSHEILKEILGGIQANKYGVENTSTQEFLNFSNLTVNSIDKPAEVKGCWDQQTHMN